MNERLFCYTEVQSAEYHYPFYLNVSQCLCIFYFKLVIWEKISSIGLFEFLTKFPLKNAYFYQGMAPISKVKTLLAFVSICVCNAQCKSESPIVLHGTWSVGILIRRHLHPDLNCRQLLSDKLPNRWNINQVNISSLFNDTIRIVLKTWKNCNASTLLNAPTGDLPPQYNRM